MGAPKHHKTVPLQQDEALIEMNATCFFRGLMLEAYSMVDTLV
jgi:hypothetical protein